MGETLKIRAPDDWHCHLRDGDYLPFTVAHTAKHFRRAIVMPNLQPAITDVKLAHAYRQRILQAVPASLQFTPLMTLYLTDKTTLKHIQEAKQSGIIYGCKLYPAGVTTNSQAGVTDLTHLYPILNEMMELNIPLLIHGEVNNREVDIFDREKVFIEKYLQPITEKFSRLKIVLEHITTRDAVQFVEEANENVAATITPHHLWLNRNDLLAGLIRPHYYCLPILKRQTHQQALIQAAISANPKFFMGTDSAPHPQNKKESACGCAGIFNTHCAIGVYATIFEQHHALDKLEQFMSLAGSRFYNLPPNTDYIELYKEPWQIPTWMNYGKETIVPFLAGESVQWQTKEKNYHGK